MLLRTVLLVGLTVFVSAKICPFEEHVVCNEDIDEEHACMCAVGLSEKPVTERSCNRVVNAGDNSFPVVSIKFKLDEAANTYKSFPEVKFKEEIGSALKVDEEDIVVIRQSCTEENDQLIVQFVIKDKDVDDGEMPFEASDFVEPTEIVNKMKVIGFLSQIADLDVDEMVATDELEPIESNEDNSQLMIEAAVCSTFIVFTCIIAVWMACKSNNEPEYSDNLQKV